MMRTGEEQKLGHVGRNSEPSIQITTIELSAVTTNNKRRIMTTRKKAQKKKEQKAVPLGLKERVLSLWEKDNNSANALGAALEEVKKCKPHGGLGEWIRKNLGDTVSVRNRCSYCQRLYLGKIKPKGGGGTEGTPKDKEFSAIITEVNQRFKQLYEYAKAGDVDPASLMAKKITEKVTELVETAKNNAAKMNKKELAAGATA